MPILMEMFRSFGVLIDYFGGFTICIYSVLALPWISLHVDNHSENSLDLDFNLDMFSVPS